MQLLTTTVARYLFIIPFAIFGIMHFMNAGQMTGYVPSFIPGGIFWVYLVGLAHLLAAVAFIIEKQARLAGLLLAALLIIFVLTIHIPAVAGGNTASMSAVLKDLALAGGALTWAGLFDDSKSAA